MLKLIATLSFSLVATSIVNAADLNIPQCNGIENEILPFWAEERYKKKEFEPGQTVWVLENLQVDDSPPKTCWYEIPKEFRIPKK